jgi:hypothetical protein
MRRRSGFLVILLLLCSALAVPLAAATNLSVGKAWSRTPVRYSAVKAGKNYFVAYYAPDRSMMLAVVPVDGGEARNLRLPSRYRGRDTHRFTAIAVDTAGIVHVSGNMHNDPLVYFQIRPPYQQADVSTPTMIGRDESSVTYPAFYPRSTGLVFTYRDGRSGDGVWYFNEWNGKSWRRLGAVPAFTSRYQGNTINAYPCVAAGWTGPVHFGLLWREKGGTQNNIALTYAKTSDFEHWTRLDGKPISTPVTLEASDKITAPGPNQSLRDCEANADSQGRPLIAYSGFDSEGKNAGFVARGDAGGWKISEVKKTDKHVVLVRTPGQPVNLVLGVKPVTFTGSSPVACFREGRTVSCSELDPSTLAIKRSARVPFAYTMDVGGESGRRLLAVVDTHGDETGDFLSWDSMGKRALRNKCGGQNDQCEGMSTDLRIVSGK